MLAGDEPPLAVARVAVGVARRLAEGADLAGRLVPFQDAVVRDVAPQQVAAVAEPDRPLGPAAAGIEPLDRRAEDPVGREALVEHLDRGVRIAHRGAPGGARGIVDRHLRAPLSAAPSSAQAFLRRRRAWETPVGLLQRRLGRQRNGPARSAGQAQARQVAAEQFAARALDRRRVRALRRRSAARPRRRARAPAPATAARSGRRA